MPPANFDGIILRCHTAVVGSKSMGRMPCCGHSLATVLDRQQHGNDDKAFMH
jgi:hypothetical protein